MSYYNYDEVEKKSRRKVISIAVAVTVLILVLVTAIIVVATTRNDGGEVAEGENAEFIIEGETPVEEVTDAGNSALGTITTEETTEEEVTLPAETVTTITQTGPEEALPMAILLGVLTMVGTAAFAK
ncbi:MAG: hypothetical protein Q4B34_03115, partial [Candidatus Saccharibacteria bacterium]|nr:hypothetical protein [Candidatus Saccharibacteria bacterium]